MGDEEIVKIIRSAFTMMKMIEIMMMIIGNHGNYNNDYKVPRLQ